LLVGLTSASMLLVAAPLIAWAFKEIGYQFTFPSYQQVRQDIALGFPLVLTYVLDFLLSGSDRFLLAYFTSAEAVGQYAPAFTVASIVLMIPKTIGVALPPMLSRLVDSNRRTEAEGMTKTAIRFYLLLGIPFVVGCSLLGGKLLTILATPEVGQNAQYVPGVISAGMLFYGMNLILSSSVAFVALRTKEVVASNIVAATASIVLNVLLIPVFKSIYVPAAVAAVSYLLSYAFLHTRLKGAMDIRLKKSFVVRTILSALLMGVVVVVLNPILGQNTVGIIVEIVVAALSYSAFAAFTGAVSAEERKTLLALVPTLFSRRQR